MSHKRPVSTGRVGERTSLYVTIALKASPVFILLQVRVLAPAEKETWRKLSLFSFCHPGFIPGSPYSVKEDDVPVPRIIVTKQQNC